MWQPGKTIPTNLITGFLGTGKTTAVRQLIEHRPEGERWSVFINEYGMVSIDQALLPAGDDGVQVEELGGGCFCCTMAYLVEPTLVSLIRRTRPDRLLIEPSGAGHPARVIDMLRGERFRTAIDLRATIALVDPQDFLNPRVRDNPVFADQIHMADVVAINWSDVRSPEAVAGCREWVTSFDPPKLHVATTAWGRLDLAWLDLQANLIRSPQFPAAHEHAVTEGNDAASHHEPQLISLGQQPRLGQPVRLENSGADFHACGWLWSADDVFDRHAVVRWLGSMSSVRRLKGVLHCRDDWWAVNCVHDHVTWERSAYRHDSRLEIIVADAAPSWDAYEAAFKSCLADVKS